MLNGMVGKLLDKWGVLVEKKLPQQCSSLMHDLTTQMQILQFVPAKVQPAQVITTQIIDQVFNFLPDKKIEMDNLQ